MRIINTADAPSHQGPVPQAIEHDRWIFVSALFGVDPVSRSVPASARDEADLLLRNLEAVLGAADAGLGDVLQVRITMRDLYVDRPIFNEVWTERLGKQAMARSAIQAPAFGPEQPTVRFMIEAIARTGAKGP